MMATNAMISIFQRIKPIMKFLCAGKTLLPFLACGVFSTPASAINISTTPSTTSVIEHISYRKSFSAEDVSGFSGKNVKVRITLSGNLANASTNNLWLRIFGLPENLKFSKGAKTGDIWFINLHDLSNLNIISPSDYQGTFSLNLFLMRRKELTVTIVAKAAIKVQLERDNTPTTSSVDSTSKEPTHKVKATKAGLQPGKIKKLPVFEEILLLERGKQLLIQGKLSLARNVYRELVDRGSSKGALALAESYVSEGKSEMAEQWYKKAKELGDDRLTH